MSTYRDEDSRVMRNEGMKPRPETRQVVVRNIM